MNIRKSITHMLAVSALALVAVGAASAQAPVGIAVGGAPNPGDFVTFTGGTGLNISTTDYNLTGKQGQGMATGTTLNLFAPDQGIASSNGVSTQELLGPGTFTITGGGNTLLSGTFGNSLLSASNGSSSATVSLMTNSVNYDAFDTFFPAGFSLTGGSLGVTITGAHSGNANGIIVTAPEGTISDFSGNDGINFAAPRTVPEPGTVASFALGGLGLLGLAVRGRKSRLA